MLNGHLSYKTPSSWRIIFQYGGIPRHFSILKKFRSLVVPGGGCRKGTIIQGMQPRLRFSVTGQSCRRIKGDVTGASVHVPRQSNSTYAQTVRWTIYKTRRPEHPHLPIRWYKRRPQGPPASRPRYTLMNYQDYKILFTVHSDDSNKQFGDFISKQQQANFPFLEDTKQAKMKLYYDIKVTSINIGISK